MIIARDHYFASWAITKGVNYVLEGGKIKLDLDTVRYNKLVKDYKSTDKPLLDRVRNTIKELNLSRGSYGGD